MSATRPQLKGLLMNYNYTNKIIIKSKSLIFQRLIAPPSFAYAYTYDFHPC